MNDDLAPSYLAHRVTDDELEADLARLRQSRQASQEKGFLEPAGDDPLGFSGVSPLQKWIGKLPRNITVAVMDAAMNTLQFADDLNAAADQNVRAKAEAHPGGPDMKDRPRPEPLAPELMEAGRLLRGELAADSTTGDQITQSAAQFFIPFGAALMGFNAMKATSTAGKVARGLAAESVAVASAFEPHEARFADLLRLAEPENGLVNAYIDYLAADEEEGELEGRFKNVVDNVVASLGIASVIKAGAVALRHARKAALTGAVAAAPSQAGQDGQDSE